MLATSRASSASLSDDDFSDHADAITPIDEHLPDTPMAMAMPANPPPPPPLPPSTSASASPAAMLSALPPPDSPSDNARLWRRMLALQRRYHCYNSARMSAALESESVEAAVPPRACLDLLNDSIASQWLGPADLVALLAADELESVPLPALSRAAGPAGYSPAGYMPMDAIAFAAQAVVPTTPPPPAGRWLRRRGWPQQQPQQQQQERRRRRVWRRRREE